MTTTSRPFAAVIIPHYNDHARLERCLRELWAAGVPNDIEVVVVDNGSSPPLMGFEWFSGLRIVTEPQKGAAHARNRGVAETEASRLWFIDSDCVPVDDWMQTARLVCDRADIVGGDVQVFDEGTGRRTGAEGFEALFAFDCKGYVEQMGFAVTANLLTRRDVFERAGDFIDGVPEDKEWCHRALRNGADIVYEPTLRVRHPSRHDWQALRRKWVRLTKEAWHDQQRRPFGTGLWALRAVVVMASALVHLPRVLRSDKLVWNEKLATALTLLRLRAARGIWMMGQLFGVRL